MSVNPFVDIQLSPSYGDRTCLVNWILQSRFRDGLIFVFRSVDGVKFELLNDQPVVLTPYYIDSTLPADNRIDNVYYRLLLIHEGQEYDSNIIGFFDKLTRYEYGMVHAMIQRKFLHMRTGNGLEVLFYVPLTTGTPCDYYDPETQQVTGVDCPDKYAGNPEMDCFGQKFRGGYTKPVNTWMKVLDSGPIMIIDSEAGLGQVDEYTVQAHMLAFPRPKKDDLIIHPPTDNRYAVGEVVKPYMFKGIVPIAYDVKLHLLRRDDPRYRVPIPKP